MRDKATEKDCTQICSKCNHNNRPCANFCSMCGNQIREILIKSKFSCIFKCESEICNNPLNYDKAK